MLQVEARGIEEEEDEEGEEEEEGLYKTTKSYSQDSWYPG
jgi:hypothetical protein